MLIKIIIVSLVFILPIIFACVLYWHKRKKELALSNLTLSTYTKTLNEINLAIQSAGLIRWNINLLTNINSFINIDNNEYTYTNSQIFRLINADDYSKLRSLISQIKQDIYINPITIGVNLFGNITSKSYEVTATLVRNKDGSPSHSYGLLKDVSERCRNQKLLNREVYINKTIWKSSNNCVYFHSPTGLWKDVNNTGLNHFGFTKDQVIDRFNLFSLNHISQESKDALRNGVSKNISEEMKAKIDLIDVNAILDNQNRELNLKNQLLKKIIDQIPGLLFIKDISNNHKYSIVNNEFCKLIANNSSMDQVVGSSDYDYFPKEVADRLYQGDLLCIKNNKPFEIDENLILDGCSSMWRTIKVPITLANNKKLLICLSLDVTEIYRLKNKAQESDALKSQFLANMSHELRTPLNAIVGFSNLLMDADDYETKKEFNEIITTNSELLLNLVNDILDLSKIESGIISFVDEYINLNDLLDDTYLTFNMRTQPNVTLRCEKLVENWWIEIDKLKLNQILNNFLSNAIKYTPSGEIVFGCAIEREGIHLFVKDTGIGITDEKKEKVFGRFEKLDTFAQGTGLGLSICKALVGLKKGEIGFESTLGEGSYFWAWIPCKKSSQSGSKTNSN